MPSKTQIPPVHGPAPLDRPELMQDKVLEVLGANRVKRVKSKATQIDVYTQDGDSFTIQVNGKVVHIGNTSSNNLSNAISKALEKLTNKLITEGKPYKVERYDL